MQEQALFAAITDVIKKEVYSNATDFIPLHAPVFQGNEKKYLCETIDSTFVSSVGEFVNQVEIQLAEFTGARFAIATGNGTLALHAALILAGVEQNTEVITQPLSFVATGNAILYCKARPVFVDVDKDTASLSPESLLRFLNQNALITNDGTCLNKNTGARISACVPMHSFGFTGRIGEIADICKNWNIPLVEDSAESLGSYLGNIHTGRFGQLGVLSFNGNKTITCGGGGAILTDSETLAKKAKHITTTAKVPHKWEFFHDELGYNYRMPNLNAALLVAQLEQLPHFLSNKAETAALYKKHFSNLNIQLLQPLEGTTANYWLNTLIFENKEQRDGFLQYSNNNGVMTRPAWTLMNKMPAFSQSLVFETENAQWLEDRLVNIPSSVR
jgi:aminotransferase in exopolysaccharide biosynthesis